MKEDLTLIETMKNAKIHIEDLRSIYEEKDDSDNILEVEICIANIEKIIGYAHSKLEEIGD
jgi:hypothetical protein